MSRESLARSEGPLGDRLARSANQLGTVLESVDVSADPGVEPRADRLAEAAAELGAVFETVDLGAEPELARAVLDALKATDRARRLAGDR